MHLPQLRRDLIRRANRDHLTAEGVADILELADRLVLLTSPEDEDLLTAEHIYRFWEESFGDVEP